MKNCTVTSNSFREKLQRNPKEILDIFWDNLENQSRGESKRHPVMGKKFIFFIRRWKVDFFPSVLRRQNYILQHCAISARKIQNSANKREMCGENHYYITFLRVLMVNCLISEHTGSCGLVSTFDHTYLHELTIVRHQLKKTYFRMSVIW